nr:hypothetical protein [Tanacetum cinerariifolium]
VLRVADTYDYLYKPCPNQPFETASEEDKAAWKAEYKKHNDASRKSMSAHVLEMKGPLTRILVILLRTSICIAWGKTLTELHALLIDYEKGLKDKAPTPQVLTIQKGRDNKPKSWAQEEELPSLPRRVVKNKDKAEHGAAASGM